MTAKELVDPNYPSPFYALFEGAVDVSLRFPVGPDGGPLWDGDGAIKSSHCPDVTDEDVSVVDLGSGHYRLAERCFGPFSELRLYWGDEFMASSQAENELVLLRVMPRKFQHYRFIRSGFSNDDPVAGIVHSLDGGWETVAKGMLTITIPASKAMEFERQLHEQNLIPGLIHLEV